MVDGVHRNGLGDLLREHRRSWPQQLAVVDGEVRLTYPELDDRVNRAVHALAGSGVGAGDRILWLGQNSYLIVELLFAAAKLGAILCPANWRQTADELAFVLDDLDPAVVVWQDAEIGDTVRAARALAPGRGPMAATRRDRARLLRRVRRSRRRRATRSIATSRSIPANRCCCSTPRPSTAGPTARCSATPRSSGRA